MLFIKGSIHTSSQEEAVIVAAQITTTINLYALDNNYVNVMPTTNAECVVFDVAFEQLNDVIETTPFTISDPTFKWFRCGGSQ